MPLRKLLCLKHWLCNQSTTLRPLLPSLALDESNMGIHIFSPAERTTINWASGTSTEIFIYPSNGSFADRNFQFRISTATVEAEESTFTFFEGITRQLMILKGELELIHEGRYTKQLKPFDQDTFSGEWSTRSKGKVTDFNLMLKGGATGTLNHHVLTAGNSLKLGANSDYFFIYIASGSASLDDGTDAHSGDLVQVSETPNVQLTGAASLIEICVNLP